MSKPVCIVTGAGRGIGQAAAVELDRLGWSIALVSRTQSELDATAAKLSSAIAIVADVSKSAEVDAAVAKAVAHFGRVDAVVNSAGAAPLVPIEKTTDAQFHLAMDCNLGHVLFMTRAVWPHFKAQRAGVIVNISSIASRDPFDGFGVYGAAKAAINTFSLVASREGAPHNIRCHVVAPGAVETSMLRSVFSTDVLPQDKTLDPSDLGKVIAQVVAGDLRHTNGEVLWVHR